MEVQHAVRLKRAVRNFDTRALPENVVQAILNAGRRAQSSKNSQPWQFIAITDKNILKQLAGCGEWAGHLAGAALGIAIVHPDPSERFQILFDVGQSAAYMQLAGWELGVGSCLATLYDGEKARQVLGFPNDMTIRFAISFGYPADPAQISNPPHKGGRKEFNETVHWNRW